MTVQKTITLSKEELKKILCKEFEVQEAETEIEIIEKSTDNLIAFPNTVLRLKTDIKKN